MNLKNAALALTLLLSTAAANASGAFHVSGYGNGVENVAGEIADIVTEDFLREFNSKSYVIVVMYRFDQIDQDVICSATAGVSKSPPGNRTAAIPDWRFSVTKLVRNAGTMSYGQRKTCLVESIRGATKSLMEAGPATIRVKSAASL